MKAIIKEVTYKNEFEGKFGTLHSFKVSYDDKVGFYNSKSKDQKKFVKGQEAEFTEEKRNSGKGDFYIIKPMVKDFNKSSSYGKALQREQSKYSGFAVSYVKDLIIADKLPLSLWQDSAEKIALFMAELDKKIGS